MKSFLLSLFVCIACVADAQTHTTINIGMLDSVYSTILKEKRKIWIALPDTTSPDGIFYTQRYPVIYLLDGDEASFAATAVLLKQLSGGGGNIVFPKMILVGIPNTNRTRDLTPTHVSSVPPQIGIAAANTGGGEQFISFLEKELIPHIDSLYPAAPYRMLIGHSFGGLTAIHILVNHPQLFNAYIASDPSMWWDDQHLLNQIRDSHGQLPARALFLSMANTLPAGSDTLFVKNDTSFSSLHIRSILELGHWLGKQQNELKFQWKYYADYDHGSVSRFDTYDGLLSLLSFYKFQLPFDLFFQPGYKGDTLLAAHYREISRQMGYTVFPPEQLVSTLAHQLASEKQVDRAMYFFNLNRNNYPRSFHTYVDLGDFYRRNGNKQMATENYTIAISLYDNPEIKAKLNSLKTAN